MKKIALLMVLMVLQTLVFIPSIAITMEEEEAPYVNCYNNGCPGRIELRCTNNYVSSFTKSCNKNFGACTVTVHKYLHGGFCDKCMSSLGESHDHVEYHTNSNCFSPQWVCIYY